MMNWKKVRPYLFVFPAILVFCFFYIYPILYMLYLSFHEWNFVSPDKLFVGIDNFINLFSDKIFLKVLKNTFVYTVGQVGLTAILSLVIAVWLNKKSKIHNFVQSAIFSPHIISLVSVAMLWVWLLDSEYGLVNYVLSFIGIEKIRWLESPKWAMFSLILVQVWKSLGYNVVILCYYLKIHKMH